jgi:hypothetical protein
MESIGLMPSSTGRPGGNKVGDRIADYAIEGGRFLQVCTELLTQSFKITWYDRFPDERVVIGGSHSLACQLENMPESATRIIANQENSQVTVRTAVNNPNKISNQTRMKYSCACGNNLWAKPNLHVRCCECNEEYEYA